MTPRISIVVPLYVLDDRFRADFRRFDDLDYPDFEILVVSDAPVDVSGPRVRTLVTGAARTGPAEKRDFALPHCTGEICAFIDDDAYPHPQWLRRAARYFDDPGVAAVGGPGVTPPADGLLARAGGAVYESLLGSGGNVYRFRPCAARDVDDYPAYNLFVRKSVLEAIGGWASTFYGGEDTKVCLAIVRRGWRIAYDPDVVVFHHRRRLFAEHMRQIYNVGVHRGFFVKRFPETSRRAMYFLPTLGLAAAVAGLVAAAFWPVARPAVLGAAAVFLIAAFGSTWAVSRSVPVALLASLGVVATHVAYGAAFVKGLTLRELHR